MFALAVSAPAVRAQTPRDGDAGARAAPDCSAPAAHPPIVGYELGGSRIDPDDQLRALMFSVAGLGDPFVEAGPSDRIGRPFGTIPRLVQALDAVGYRAALSTRAAPGGVIITATLLPYERLRYVFVSGNRRIQQDEIQRRITIRPGQTLPPVGPERVAVLERERELIIDFLRSRGYFEANVGLDAKPGTAPARSTSTSRFASARPIRSGLSPSPAITPSAPTSSIRCSGTATGSPSGTRRSPSPKSSCARTWTPSPSVTGRWGTRASA